MTEKVKVMAIDNNIDICEILETIVKSDPDLEWVGYAEDGLLALQKIGRLNPDVILLDIIMPNLNGVAFLKQLAAMYPEEKPKIIVLSAVSDQELVRRFSHLGADYYLLKPIDATILINRIKQVVGLIPPETRETRDALLKEPEQDTEKLVAELLFGLHMPTYFKGYLYLKDAICMIIENVDVHTPITTTLYTKIAAKHDTTPSVVEAAIRYAIHETWKRGDTKRLKKLFGPFSNLSKEQVPTNSLFMTRVAEEIRISTAGSRSRYPLNPFDDLTTIR